MGDDKYGSTLSRTVRQLSEAPIRTVLSQSSHFINTKLLYTQIAVLSSAAASKTVEFCGISENIGWESPPFSIDRKAKVFYN